MPHSEVFLAFELQLGGADRPLLEIIDRSEALEAAGDVDAARLRRFLLAAEMNRCALANVNFPPTGQFSSLAVGCSELQGVVASGFPVLWNIRRGRE